MRPIKTRGYFAIGISHGKTVQNIGSLWRSAQLFGAAFCFTIGKRYKRQASDTTKVWRHIPLIDFATFDDLKAHIPMDCLLIGVELDARAVPMESFVHPPRAVYLLGAEDNGLSREEREACHRLVQLPGDRSMNVSNAGTLTMYARHLDVRANRLTFRRQAEAAE